MLGRELGENGVEIGFGLAGIQAAERVIGAELDDHHLGILGQGPVEPGEPAGRGVARNPAVQDPGIEALSPQGLLELGHETLSGRQPIARRQAVSQGEDLDGRGLGAEGAQLDDHRQQHHLCQA